MSYAQTESPRAERFKYASLGVGGYALKKMNGHRAWESHLFSPRKPHEVEVLARKTSIEHSLFEVASPWFAVSEKALPTKEVYEMPAGLRAERVVANVAKAPARFVRSIEPDSFDLDTKLIENEDIYYNFSLWGVKFLAKREGNLVRVFEAYESKDGKIVALPRYEVKIK